MSMTYILERGTVDVAHGGVEQAEDAFDHGEAFGVDEFAFLGVLEDLQRAQVRVSGSDEMNEASLSRKVLAGLWVF